MFNPDKPVQTRGGRKARIVSTNGDNTFQIAAWIEGNNEEHMEVFDASGSYYGDGKENRNDLINIPETHVRYINFYPNDKLYIDGFETKEEADRYNEDARSKRIACIRVEFKDGQFDE